MVEALGAALVVLLAALGGLLALFGGLLSLLVGLVMMIVAPVLILLFWLVAIVTSPIWLIGHAILTACGRRGFIIERDGEIVLSLFTVDAFKKAR